MSSDNQANGIDMPYQPITYVEPQPKTQNFKKAVAMSSVAVLVLMGVYALKEG